MKISKNCRANRLNFYSEEMFISEKYLIENHLKLTYQRNLISNLDSKHKYWARKFCNKIFE